MCVWGGGGGGGALALVDAKKNEPHIKTATWIQIYSKTPNTVMNS